VTRTVSTKTVSPKKTTITKTVVTEKEEKYEKKEIITYSGNKDFLNSLDNGSDIREKLRKLDALSTGTTNVSPTKKTTNNENVRNVHFNSTRTETSRASSAATSSEPRDVDQEEEKDEPVKSSSRYRTATTPARDLWAGRTTPTAAAAPLPAEADEDRFAGRKARLASLADKFRNMDDDLRHFTPGSGVKDTPPGSPGRARAHSPVKTDHLVRSRSPVKEPAVRSNAMQFISPAPATATTTTNGGVNREGEEIVRPRPAASPVRSFRSVSPTKAAGPVGVGSRGKPDESLYTSLKAQGFTESESASKLVYKFSETEENTRGGVGVQGSRAFNRSPSPYRSPSKGLRQTPAEEDKEEVVQQERVGRAASRNGGAILSSPTRSAVEPRSVSPSKPHPLQFVSPQVAAAAAAAQPPPPPKPTRTYETPKAAPAPAAKSWKMQVETPVASVVSSHQQLEDDRCDTPVLKTVSQKRSMFESRRAPSPPAVDPALLSLTDRKALFEKNQTVPTPVARFGESVTPAMLASRAGTTENGGGRNPPAGEAWRRKRELSPSKQMPSAKRPSPESYVVSATKVRRGAGASPEKTAEERGVLPPSSSKKVPPAVLPKTQAAAAAMRKPAEIVDPSPSTPQLGRKVRRNLNNLVFYVVP
jgi:hypothetical protein